MEKIKKPRGTMDIMPPEIRKWQYIENKCRDISLRFGFGEIRTPTFEELGLFKRGVGESTDVVQKEMYTLSDKENKLFALRPEGTASVARAIIENGKAGDVMPLKLFYLINCFRYEKPQAGRSREFYQFGAELYGASSPASDFTIISLANTLISELGIKNVSLNINSIGCPKCRPEHRKKLISYFSKNREHLCDTCKDRLERSPLRILDCKNESCSIISGNAPKTIEHLCSECENHMDSLKMYLKETGIQYIVNPNIVRGLDYYTKTVFEFIAEGIGAQSTICGGGRYDGLMEQLGGASLPGIGFAMGLSRLILAMAASEAYIPDAPAPQLYIAALGSSACLKGLSIVSELRSKGVYAECDIMSRSLKAQMKYADKIDAKRTLIIGESEIESGKAQLKTMSDSSQQEIEIGSVSEYIIDNLL